MKPMTWAQRKAIETRYKEQLKQATCCDLRSEAGIYVLTRTDELGIKHAYVGQAKFVLERLVGHCMGYQQHIDLSIRAHKFLSDKNPCGWCVKKVEYCRADELDQKEREYILKAAHAGYQLLNKTGGGQDAGKIGIAPNSPSKGYCDGVKQGYENARRVLAPLFAKYLRVEKIKDNKLSDRALEKWENFIKGEQDNVGEKEEKGTC